MLRYVGALSNPERVFLLDLTATPLGFGAFPNSLEVCVKRFQLAARRSSHLDFPTPNGEYISRSVFAGRKMRWNFVVPISRSMPLQQR